jgi:hypothetical protein
MGRYLDQSVGRLIEARGAVGREMERLAMRRPLDRAALQRLRETARGYADQADSLLLELAQGQAPGMLVSTVEEIFDALRDAEGQIAAVMRPGRG